MNKQTNKHPTQMNEWTKVFPEVLADLKEFPGPQPAAAAGRIPFGIILILFGSL